MGNIEAEMLLSYLARRRKAEAAHRNDFAVAAHIALPAQCRCGFDRDPRAHRFGQHALAVKLVLPLKQFPGRHAHYAHVYAFARQLFIGFDAQGHFTAAAQQQ